jgi:hypothetical protein
MSLNWTERKHKCMEIGKEIDPRSDQLKAITGLD